MPDVYSDPRVSILVAQVWVNQYNVVHNNVPFGGKKQSGIGTLLNPIVRVTC